MNLNIDVMLAPEPSVRPDSIFPSKCTKKKKCYFYFIFDAGKMLYTKLKSKLSNAI